MVFFSCSRILRSWASGSNLFLARVGSWEETQNLRGGVQNLLPKTLQTLTHFNQRATSASPKPGLLVWGNSSLITNLNTVADPWEPDSTQTHYPCGSEAMMTWALKSK